MMRVQRTTSGSQHGWHYPSLRVVPALDASSVLIEFDKALSLHFDPDEALQLIGCVYAAPHALRSTGSLHASRLALFGSEA